MFVENVVNNNITFCGTRYLSHCHTLCYDGNDVIANRSVKVTTMRASKVIFTVRRYALHGLSYRNSVCPSVRPSACPSVTLVDCVHMVRPTIMISSPQGSPIILVSGDITFIPKFEGGHHERGR